MSFNFKIIEEKINNKEKIRKLKLYEFDKGKEKNVEIHFFKLPVDTNNKIVFKDKNIERWYDVRYFFREIENFNLLLSKYKVSDTNEIALWVKFLKDVMFEEHSEKEPLKLKSKYLNYEAFVDFKDKYYNYIKALPFKSDNFTLKTKWRLIVGLGTASTSETSITLHHIYGIPYIPGSAVKGVVRSFIIQEVFGREEQDLKNAEKKAMENEAFINIFGSQDQEGKIIFFDAFPIEAPSIEPDVMNVHYPDYYSDTSGKIPPTDYQNPNPIFFLTVRGKFKFVIAARKKNLTDKEYIITPPIEYQAQKDNNYASGTIMWWLYEALSVHGIGAKTAVGYGRMKNTEHNEGIW